MDAYLYEGEEEDFLLEPNEEKIMVKMRELDQLFKNYKKKAKGNRLILFCGGSGCSIRVGSPSKANEIESYDFITCDGGDGADNF